MNKIINFDNFSQTEIKPEFLDFQTIKFYEPYNTTNAYARSLISQTLNIEPHKIFFFSSVWEVFSLLKKFFSNYEIFIYKNDFKNNFLFDLQKISNFQIFKSLLFINHTDNLSGEIRNFKKITEEIHFNNSLIISDLSYSLGKISLNLQKLNIDFGLINSCLFFVPCGSIIFIDFNSSLDFWKMRSIENSNIFLNTAFANALDYLLNFDFYTKLKNLRDYLISKIKIFPFKIIENQKQNPAVVLLKPDFDAEKLVYLLIFNNLNIGYIKNENLLRISFSIFNTFEEIDFFVKILNDFFNF